MEISKLKSMLLAGAAELNENKDKLNKMNVFPIPDGDTGTNMTRTIMGAVDVVRDINGRDLTEQDFDDLYNGVLMASQGNSGVILSQWFKGFFASLKYQSELSAAALNEAFLYAAESAYEAVSTPVEGTFLTVSREAQEMAEEELDESTDAGEYLQKYAESAMLSLERTPEKLSVLKEAGVVDSGGMGFVYFISGMLKALDPEYSPDFSVFGSGRVVPETKSLPEGEEYGYCTELLLCIAAEQRNSFMLSRALEYLDRVGNSVVAVQEGDTVKIHVHTLRPEDVLAYFHSYGEFMKLKIENMTLQHHETFGNL